MPGRRLRYVYKYERWTRPVYADPQKGLPHGWYADDTLGNEAYVTKPTRFSYDMSKLLKGGGESLPELPEPQEVWYVFRAKAGFYDHMDNQETAAHYAAEPELVRPYTPDRT